MKPVPTITNQPNSPPITAKFSNPPPNGKGARKSKVVDVPALQSPATPGVTITRQGATSGQAGDLVRFWNRWRENYNALVDLIMPRVRLLFEQGQRGDMAYLQWTYRTIERRHPVLHSLITACESPLENFDWDVVVVKELPEGATDAQAEAQRKAIKAAYSQIDNLDDAILHLAHADFRGYAHLQMHRSDGGHNDGAVIHLEPLETFTVCKDGLFGDWFWNPDSRAVTMPEYVLGEGNRIGGDVLPREDFIIREVARPINEIALENYVRRNIIQKNWSFFGEVFGLPSGVMIMPAGIPSEKVAEFEQAARMIAEGGTGAAPNGSDYKPNTMPHDGSTLFKAHLDQLDQDLVMVGTGGKLKMLVEKGAGDKRGSSSSQADTFDEIAEARARKIAQCFNKDFDRVFLKENFPEQPILARFSLLCADDVDVGQVCSNVAAASSAGLRPDVDWFNEITGYKMEEAPEPVAPVIGGKPGDKPDKELDAIENRLRAMRGKILNTEKP